MIYLILRGRIGNQLFMYAAARNTQISRNRCERIVVDDSEMDPKDDLLRCLKIRDVEFTSNRDYLYTQKFRTQRHCMTIYQWFIFKNSDMKRFSLEKKFHGLFSKCGYITCCNGYIPFDDEKSDNVILEGYFQSEKYFIENKESITGDINLCNIVDKNSDRIDKYLKAILNCEAVCVHIRRQDYCNTAFEVCTEEYYKKAIEMMNNMVNQPFYFIFSDDIEWSKKALENFDNMLFVENNKDFEDLFLMTQCKNFIMSNSSYSWWGQYLSRNQGKIVIAPSKWMKTDFPKDIYQDNWVRID